MPLWPSNFAQFGGPHVRPLGTSGWNISFDVHWGQLVHSWHCVQEFWRKTRFFNEIGHFRHFYHFCLNEGCDTPTLKIRDSHRTTSGVNLRVPLPHTNPITSFDSWHPILLWPGALSDTGQWENDFFWPFSPFFTIFACLWANSLPNLCLCRQK